MAAAGRVAAAAAVAWTVHTSIWGGSVRSSREWDIDLCSVLQCVAVCRNTRSREWDLGLCLTSGLANTKLLRRGDFRRILRPKIFFNRNPPLRSSILFPSPEVKYRPRSHSALHFDTKIFRTRSKFAWENQVIAPSVWFPQPFSSAGRRFVADWSRLNCYRTIGPFPQKRIRWNAL